MEGICIGEVTAGDPMWEKKHKLVIFSKGLALSLETTYPDHWVSVWSVIKTSRILHTCSSTSFHSFHRDHNNEVFLTTLELKEQNQSKKCTDLDDVQLRHKVSGVIMYPGFFISRTDLWISSALQVQSPRSHSTLGGCLIRDGGGKPCTHTPHHLVLITRMHI